MLTKSVSNLFKFDPEKVSWVIKAEKEVIAEIMKHTQDLITNSRDGAQVHLTVVDSLLRIGEAAKDIVDLALPQS